MAGRRIRRAVNTPEIFWAKVGVPNANGCREWTGGRRKGKSNYGRFEMGGKAWMTHRLAWVLTTHQDIPDSVLICHTCDNPPCCEPTHLFEGTHADNMHDRDKKGRGNNAKGEAHYRAKLTEENVREIRTLYADGLTQQELADKFGVVFQTISDVTRRRNWKQVKH